jgi:hypothetical protein
MDFNDRRDPQMMAGAHRAPDGTNDPVAKLRHIESQDPDGSSPTKPTRAMYAAHKNWAVARYGNDTWKQYRAGGWDPDYNREV